MSQRKKFADQMQLLADSLVVELEPPSGSVQIVDPKGTVTDILARCLSQRRKAGKVIALDPWPGVPAASWNLFSEARKQRRARRV